MAWYKNKQTWTKLVTDLPKGKRQKFSRSPHRQEKKICFLQAAADDKLWSKCHMGGNKSLTVVNTNTNTYIYIEFQIQKYQYKYIGGSDIRPWTGQWLYEYLSLYQYHIYMKMSPWGILVWSFHQSNIIIIISQRQPLYDPRMIPEWQREGQRERVSSIASMGSVKIQKVGVILVKFFWESDKGNKENGQSVNPVEKVAKEIGKWGNVFFLQSPARQPHNLLMLVRMILVIHLIWYMCTVQQHK